MGEEHIKRVKIFVASGDDLKEERIQAILILNKLNKNFPHLHLEAVEWETDIPSGSYNKERIQDEINPYLLDCDIILAMFYSKAGKFTVEEYKLALQSQKKTFLYFKTGFSGENTKEVKKYLDLMKFKAKVEKENPVLYRSFGSVEDFDKLLYQDLNLYLTKAFPKQEDPIEKDSGIDDSRQLQPKTQNPKLKTSSPPLTPLPSRKINLIGREHELSEITKTLTASPLVLLVNGLGGIGKTEVCKAFFHDHYKEYCFAAWVDWYGSVKQSLVHALGGIKSKFITPNETDTDEERFEKIKVRLCEMNESMLLVLDNIENPETDPDIGFLCCLPASIKILASSRHHIDGMAELSLEFLKEEECVELFYQQFKGKRDDEGVKQIVRLCASHTLTVELLARTAHHEGWAVNKLLETLKTKGFNLNTGKVGINWHDETERRNFFEHLEKVFEIVNVTEVEESILVNMSVLPPIYILQESFREWLELETNDDIVSLIDKGWLKRDPEFKIYMHPVTGEVVRAKLKPNVEMCLTLIISLRRKLKCEPGDNPFYKKEFLPYGESLVHWFEKEINADLSALANNLSAIHFDLGHLNQALEYQLKDIAISEKVLGENHPDLATSYNNLSMIYSDMGQLDRALEFQLKDIAILEKVFGENHPSLATSYNNLSGIYWEKGQQDRALEFQLKALTIREKFLDENHPDLAQSYNNFSWLYQEQGQLDRALEFQLKALSIRELVLGENHPGLATSYNNLSRIYQDMRQLDQALEFQLKALKIRESVLGQNHPDRAQSYHNLSLIYRDKYDYSTAETFAEKAVKILEFNFPNGHPNLDSARENLKEIRSVKAK